MNTVKIEHTDFSITKGFTTDATKMCQIRYTMYMYYAPDSFERNHGLEFNCL